MRETFKILGGAIGAPSVVHRASDAERRRFGKGYTRDAFDPMAFQFRMGAGFYGDVNRTHPFSVEPGLLDPTNPPLYYGQACVIDATSKKVRRILSTDTALVDLWGFAVRPFPFQDSGLGAAFGAQALGGFTNVITNQPIDVLRSGYMINYVNGSPGKGDPVYIWIAATAGANNQGFPTTTTTGGSVIEITGNDKTAFNGPPDANGAGEIIFNV